LLATATCSLALLSATACMGEAAAPDSVTGGMNGYGAMGSFYKDVDFLSPAERFQRIKDFMDKRQGIVDGSQLSNYKFKEVITSPSESFRRKKEATDRAREEIMLNGALGSPRPAQPSEVRPAQPSEVRPYRPPLRNMRGGLEKAPDMVPDDDSTLQGIQKQHTVSPASLLEEFHSGQS
ncbi:MAG TPA: hypothetical protein V6D17_15385, partial [Candidatus Obscuribacterales bacterium]